MASPVFFSDGSTPKYQDPKWRILQKILGALNDSILGGTIDPSCLTGLFSVPTVVELRQVDVDTCPPVQAWTNGMDVEGDGQGSRYYWSGISLDVDDGLSVICPDSRGPLDPGRWLQITGVA